MNVSITEKIKCVEREISKRRFFYPRWISDGRMTQEKADDEIRLMEAVLETLKSLEAQRAGSGKQLGLSLFQSF